MIGFLPGSSRRQTQKRIERIQSRRITANRANKDVSLRRKGEETKGIVYWLLKPLPDFKNLGDILERAGNTTSPKRYVFKRFVSFLLILGGCTLFKLNIFVSIAIATVVGVWLPFKTLSYKVNKRNKAFLRLFPDAIDLIVRGLRSGLPVSESLVVVSKEVPDPVGAVFDNVANTMKLGVPLEKALLEAAKKLRLTEFNFFTTSIVLQRETGGNLSEILNNLSEVLRSRFIMQMKIRAMTSEARASSIIIGSLPFLVILAMLVISPNYMTPLVDDYRGNIAAAIALGMLTMGIWTMNRMAKFEI